jgi:hypothetical protein
MKAVKDERKKKEKGVLPWQCPENGKRRTRTVPSAFVPVAGHPRAIIR